MKIIPVIKTNISGEPQKTVNVADIERELKEEIKNLRKMIRYNTDEAWNKGITHEIAAYKYVLIMVGIPREEVEAFDEYCKRKLQEVEDGLCYADSW